MLLSGFSCNNLPILRNISYIVSTLRASVLIFIVLYVGLLVYPQISLAKSVQTYVTVGNSIPTFTVQPSESIASFDSSPVNVGTSITFTATATDSNNDGYYLAICKSDIATTGVGGGAPVCSGGNWCISGLTTSGSIATCSHNVIQGDPETGNWYAFVCDNNSDSRCSASSQGSGNSGSPFIVNHPPTFTSIGNTTPVDVGTSVSWTTGIGTSDSDTVGSADTVKLVVCKTSGIIDGDCDGGASDRWCQSNPVANRPVCSYGVPSPTADTTYNAFVYVVDSHNLAASGATQGTASNYIVNNAVPIVSAITINGGSDINLNEGVGATTGVILGASVVDENGCDDITAGNVTAYLYRSGIGYNGCDTVGEASNGSCYPVITCSTSNCSGGVASANYTCTVFVKSYADPTDTNTPYTAQNWLDTVKAVDNNSAVGVSEVSLGVEVTSLFGIDVTNSIDFGNLGAGDKNDPLNKITIVTSTGNIGLDEELSGTDMSDGASHTIAVSYQKYALSIGTSYDAATALSTTGTVANLQIPKVATDVGNTKPTYWGLLVPVGTIPGSYSGTNTVLAVKSALGAW